MVDTKKEQERDELHRAIWAIADELRGAVDGWDFKNYVLGTMFYRYISENLTNYINQGEIESGNIDFDYAKMSDDDAEEARQGLIEEKGFFISPSELFCNVLDGAPEDEKLVKLLSGVANMNLGSVHDHDIDAFGDAYEYLMTMCASNAGKSGGEFFTPADVSELLTRFELIVSNPPYSIKWAGDEDATLINDPRFAPAGVLAPKSKADLAFIMHSLSWLASNGTAAIVCFPGIMYRGGAEQKECVKVTNNNKLTSENVDKIVDVFTRREEVKHFTHLVGYEEVAENDYNLSVSTYVEAKDTREKIDIKKLNAEIEQIVVREQVLRDEIAKIIAEIEV